MPSPDLPWAGNRIMSSLRTLFSVHTLRLPSRLVGAGQRFIPAATHENARELM
jgi:hypothetical protein